MTTAGGGAPGSGAVPAPSTKAARQARIAAILSRERVHSQEQLAEMLHRYAGLSVAQATLSRDLDDLGVVRLRGPDGALVYALPELPGGPGSRPGLGLGAAMPDSPERPAVVPDVQYPAAGGPAEGSSFGQVPPRLVRHLKELLTSAEASANLVVMRTPAGAAQFLASVIDHAAWPVILGTVAGDDTVLVITRDPAGGDTLAAEFLRLADRRGLSLAGTRSRARDGHIEGAPGAGIHGPARAIEHVVTPHRVESQGETTKGLTGD